MIDKEKHFWSRDYARDFLAGYAVGLFIGIMLPTPLGRSIYG